MTGTELKTRRIALDLTQAQMARVLKTPLRTYTGWEACESQPPGVAEAAMDMFEELTPIRMQRVISNVTARIDADWPNGTPVSVQNG